jgi:ferric-dicitrate binding protein FerR (iron transport regulator)
MVRNEAFLFFPLFGFFLLCALLSWRQAANPERTAAEHAQELADEGRLPPATDSAYAAYVAQHENPEAIMRRGRRRAIFFGVLAAATIAFILFQGAK